MRARIVDQARDRGRWRSAAIMLVAIAMIAWACVLLGARFATPTDGLLVAHGAAAFDGVGVHVTGDDAALVPNAIVTAIDGTSIDRIPWLAAPRPVGPEGHVYRLEVDGRIIELTRPLLAFPVASFVWAAAPLAAILAALLALAVYVAIRRPREPSAQALLLFAAGGVTSAVSYLGGPGLADLAGGPLVPLAALGIPVYALTWIAAIAFLLMFPRPWPFAVRHARMLVGAGVVVVVLPIAAVLLMGSDASMASVERIVTAYADGIEEPALIVILGLLAAGVALHRDPESRSSYAWLAFGFGGSAALTLLVYAGEGILDAPLIPRWADALVALPLVAGLAYGVLLRRAFELDVVVNRSLVYGGVTLAILGVYAASVTVVSLVTREQTGILPALVTTGIAAVAVQPIHERVRRAVNRLMYADRDDPYGALSKLGRRLEASLTPASALDALVRSIAAAFRLPWVAVEIGDGSQIAASTGRPTSNVDRITLSHGGTEIGTLLLGRRADPLVAREQHLLTDLVRQAGAVVGAVRLIDDLQRAREQLVVAREEQRRRVRNELHDDIGQSLAALGLELQAIRSEVPSDANQRDRSIGAARASCERLVADLHRIAAGLADRRPGSIDTAPADGTSSDTRAPAQPTPATSDPPASTAAAGRERVQRRWTRGSVVTAVGGVVIILVGLGSAVGRVAIPTDGWRLTPESTGWLGAWRLVADRPLVTSAAAALRPGDAIVSVGGRSAIELVEDALALHAVPPPSGSTSYVVERQGATVVVPVQLRTWTTGEAASVIGGSAFANPSFWALLAMGGYVLLRRPDLVAARLFFLFSTTIFASGLAESLGEPGLRVADFVDPGAFWVLQAMSSFAWSLIAMPVLAHLLLTFPVEAGWVARHRRAAIALLYLALPILIAVAIALPGPQAFERWSLLVTLASACQVGLITIVAVHLVRSIRTTHEPLVRSQLRWVAWGFLTIFGLAGASLVLMALGIMDVGSSTDFGRVYLLALPAGIALSIAKHRLFDIDLVLNRTLVYGTLSASVVTIYALIVVGSAAVADAFDRTSAAPIVPASLLGAAVVTVVVQPLRDRLQRAVNRMLYGERDDPYRVLSRLAAAIEAAVSPDDALRSALHAIVQALRLSGAAIELPDGEIAWAAGSRPGSGWGPSYPLLFQGEHVGTLVVAGRGPGDTLSSGDRRLLHDLARQLAVGVHAAGSRRDLERSHQRLAEAADEERRRLRRDLHDGLGPTLSGIGLQLDAARRISKTDAGAADHLIDGATQATIEAIAEIRRLVHDLRPPALDELGLAAAIRRHAEALDGVALAGRAAPVPHRTAREPADLPLVAIETQEPLSGLPAAVEVAAFRIALEAITNVLRHAGARRCTVHLALGDGLRLEVVDDGRGLPADRPAGVGLASMRERAAELGGWCRIEDAPGGGTRVLAVLPFPHPSSTVTLAARPA